MQGSLVSGTRRPVWISTARLRDEIATLEKRLERLGADGDCGYERALIRFLQQQLGQRRELLRAGE